MTKHIRDVQILYYDDLGSLDEFGRFLMKPGVACVGDLTVQSCHLRPHFMPAIAAALAAGKCTLAPTQFFLGPACDAWIGDYHVVTAPGEDIESEIDPDRRCHRALLGRRHSNLQTHVPAATVTAKHAGADIRILG